MIWSWKAKGQEVSEHQSAVGPNPGAGEAPAAAQRVDSEGGVAAAISVLAGEIQKDREHHRIEKRRERRGSWWSWIFVSLILFSSLSYYASQYSANSKPYIARFDVIGGIADNPNRDKLFKSLAEDESVKALIVRINSPGGTTAGGEALYGSLRKVAERKPVVAVMGEIAASAGYMTAIGADYIVARGNTITGSVGVILSMPNFHGALEKIGVEFVELKSGERKAVPSPYQPLDEAKLDHERELIDEIFGWFIGLVEERREAPASSIALIRDGRVVSGRMAAELGLVDAIGGEEEAVKWLREEKSISAALPVRQRVVPEDQPTFFESLMGSIAPGLFEVSDVAKRVNGAFRAPVPISELR